MTEDVAFSRPIKVEALPRDGLASAIAATPAECEKLAEVNNLAGVSELKADFLVRRAGRAVRVTGAVHAAVTQTCVVSLEPFPVTIEEQVDVRYAREAPESTRSEPETVALDAEDPPDPIIDGKIDLGALAAEFLALALDPYPRKPGVEFAPPREDDGDESPFAALARIAKDAK